MTIWSRIQEGSVIPAAPAITVPFRIEENPDGSPVRNIAPGFGLRPCGVYPSQKSGRRIAWESKLELHSAWWAEVQAHVIASWSQPCRIWLYGDGRPVSYVPDRKDLLADGSIEYVEVKDRFDPNRDPKYTAKLEMAKQALNSLGHSFRIVERCEIEAQPGFAAVKTVQAYRRTRITAVDVSAARSAFRGHHQVSRKDIQDAVGGVLEGLPAICAMIVQRHLAFDPQIGFDPDAPLTLVKR